MNAAPSRRRDPAHRPFRASQWGTFSGRDRRYDARHTGKADAGLTERCIQRLGGKETIPVDARVIAATIATWKPLFDRSIPGRSLLPLERSGHYAAALRERKEDIPDLINYFLRRHAAEMGVADPQCTRRPSNSFARRVGRKRSRAGECHS